jgi:hypothetical protein
MPTSSSRWITQALFIGRSGTLSPLLADCSLNQGEKSEENQQLIPMISAVGMSQMNMCVIRDIYVISYILSLGPYDT